MRIVFSDEPVPTDTGCGRPATTDFRFFKDVMDKMPLGKSYEFPRPRFVPSKIISWKSKYQSKRPGTKYTLRTRENCIKVWRIK